jgi:multimeric flavodoxin WrbA
LKAVIISDRDYQTGLFGQLHAQLLTYLEGFEIEEFCIERDDLAFCTGCFGCWIKTPGECVVKDGIGRINRAAIGSDAVVYLSPVVFGQFSANIKSVIDRWLPNMLPFFIVRPDGSTMHPPRYRQYPGQVIIGYGDSVSAMDAQLFTDITKKHRRGVEAFVYDPALSLKTQIGNARLKRVEGAL